MAMLQLMRLAIALSALCTVLPVTVHSSLTRETSAATDRMAQVKAAMKEYVDGERRPLYSNDWAVQVRGGEAEAERVAAVHGFVNMGKIGNLDDHYHFRLARLGTGSIGDVNFTVSSRVISSESLHSPLSADIGLREEITQTLSALTQVGYAEQQRLRKRYRKVDYTQPTDPKFSRQWSLLNTGQVGLTGKDLNVEPSWMQGITGRGVVVSVFDDGLERTHPDISPNYDSRASYDYVHYDSDPTPDNYNGDEPDSHGTSCAGEIAMARDNRQCGVGVAYDCNIGGIKFDISSGSDLIESLGLGRLNNYTQVYSNSWGPSDYGFVVSGPGSLTKETLKNGALSGRHGKGVIYVFASGNGGRYYDSCSSDGYSNSIYTISVGSANSYGSQADYDEQCPGKMAVTYSYNTATFPGADDNWDAYNQVTTTTLSRRCTDGFTGTSASAPLMSGVVALVLQANTNLTWRDVQYLIAYTSDRDSLSNAAWQTNGAGLKVSHKFGFGAIDAEAMVTRAKRWLNVPAQHNVTVSPLSSYGTSRSYRSFTTNFTVSSTNSGGIQFLEHTVLTVSLRVRGYYSTYDYEDFFDELNYITDIDDLYDWLEDSHPRRGDIKVILRSPQGTTSTLLPYRNYDFINAEGYSSWPFMSVHHWGENPSGTWTLTVYFKSTSGYVSVSSPRLTLYGTTQTPQAVSNIPSSCDLACVRGCSGTGPDHCDACRHLRVASTLQCVTSCPTGTTRHSKYCLGQVVTEPPLPTTHPHQTTTEAVSVTTALTTTTVPAQEVTTVATTEEVTTGGGTTPEATTTASTTTVTAPTTKKGETITTDLPTTPPSHTSATTSGADSGSNALTQPGRGGQADRTVEVAVPVVVILLLLSAAAITLVVVAVFWKRKKDVRCQFSRVPTEMNTPVAV